MATTDAVRQEKLVQVAEVPLQVSQYLLGRSSHLHHQGLYHHIPSDNLSQPEEALEWWELMELYDIVQLDLIYVRLL